MPSPSPAGTPAKRPSIHERSASGQSLSSSGKQQQHIHKVHRPHLVGRHSRNVSHGKNLGKLNRVDSGANVAHAGRNHQRKKSGASTPGQSPKSPGLMKRNNSHVTLTKNTSHVNLRKNHSATLLTSRQGSHVNLKRQGLAPLSKAKQGEKPGFFQLGDRSSGEEEEGEWEDSSTQSPELTRNNSKTNSKASTPARVPTPDNHEARRKSSQPLTEAGQSQWQPANRSMPNLRREPSEEQSHPGPELLQTRRASRAPPAMSTISARAGLNTTDSNRSLEHSETATPPNTTVTEGSASADKAVSRFLNGPSTSSEVKSMVDDVSDEDSADLLNNYKPQPSESPEKPRHIQKARFSSIPSRTQQRLELERREQLRQAGGPTTPPASSLTMSGPSTLSLHSRSGSRGRTRSYIDETKALKVSYEGGVRQLRVVSRFRNPLLDSLKRLKEAGGLPSEIGAAPSKSAARNRPPSRRGGPLTNANGPAKTGQSPESHEPSPLASRSSSRGRGNRVQFQRHGSHDDIGVTPSQGSLEGPDEDDGLSPEEALMRRMWNSREVYEAGIVATP